MKVRLAALSIVFALAANECFAAGFQQITVPDPADRPLTVGIWYPAMGGRRGPECSVCFEYGDYPHIARDSAGLP
jgi:hypothetical protein